MTPTMKTLDLLLGGGTLDSIGGTSLPARLQKQCYKEIKTSDNINKVMASINVFLGLQHHCDTIVSTGALHTLLP
jgi:hypothetical protein